MAGTNGDEHRVDDEVRSDRMVKEACFHPNWNSSRAWV